MRLKLIITTFLLLITASGALYAQKTEAKQINIIKLDGRYLYGEATMPTEAEAKEAADITLINYINDKLKEHHIDRRLGLDGLEQTQYITVKKGNNIRVFAYVESSVYGIPASATQAAAQSAPAPENRPAPTAKAPEKSPAESRPAQSAPRSPQRASAPAPAASPARQSVPTRKIAESSMLSAWQNEAIEDLLNSANLNSAAQLLNEFRSAHKVLAFGSPKECPDASKCFWIVFDNNLNTITVLSSGANDDRHNFKTGAPDGLGNYSGNTAVWFILSK